MTETIGNRIRERRKALGLSQHLLASKAGVTQGLIGQIEAGTNKGSKHTVAIARALEVSPDWLERGGLAEYPMAVYQPSQTPEYQWLIAAWQSANEESREVARFALSEFDAPLPPWADKDNLRDLNTMRYAALRWLREASQKVKSLNDEKGTGQ